MCVGVFSVDDLNVFYVWQEQEYMLTRLRDQFALEKEAEERKLMTEKEANIK